MYPLQRSRGQLTHCQTWFFGSWLNGDAFLRKTASDEAMPPSITRWLKYASNDYNILDLRRLLELHPCLSSDIIAFSNCPLLSLTEHNV